MQDNNSTYIDATLPVLPLRGIVGFPAVQLNIEIARPTSLKAFTASATLHDAKILLVTQKEVDVENPSESDLYRTGVLAEIKHVVKNPQGTLNVIFEGIARAKIAAFDTTQNFITATATVKKPTKCAVTTQIEALMREIKNRLTNLKDIHPTFTEDMRLSAEAISDPGYLADFVASSAVIDYKNKQTVLETFMPRLRLEKLLWALEEEAMLLETEHSIQMQVR